MADIFISYSKSDHSIAQSLANELAASGFDVWWDFQLYAGDDFHDMIRSEIAAAMAVIVIWSDAAAASNWVRGEAEEASDQDKLISTYVSGFDPRRVPINFRTFHSEPVEQVSRIVAALERKGAQRRGAAPVRNEALAELEALAEQGDAGAQAELAYKYANGHDGLPRDDREAVRLFMLAAEQGHAGGQNSLGVCYQSGLGGLPKDEREAIRYFRLAADQGLAYAQHNLAVAYDRSLGGLAKDDFEAARLYRLAADKGLAAAQNNLGVFFEVGRGGLLQSLSEALRLYEAAAAQGHAAAKGNVARLRG